MNRPKPTSEDNIIARHGSGFAVGKGTYRHGCTNHGITFCQSSVTIVAVCNSIHILLRRNIDAGLLLVEVFTYYFATIPGLRSLVLRWYGMQLRPNLSKLLQIPVCPPNQRRHCSVQAIRLAAPPPHRRGAPSASPVERPVQHDKALQQSERTLNLL